MANAHDSATLESSVFVYLFNTEFPSTGKGELIVSTASRRKKEKGKGKKCSRA